MATPPAVPFIDGGDLRRVEQTTNPPDEEVQHPSIERFVLDFRYPVWTIVPADSDLFCPLDLANLPSFRLEAITDAQESRSPPYGTVVGNAHTSNPPSVCATFSRLDFRARVFHALTTRHIVDVRAATFRCHNTQQVLHRVLIKFDAEEPHAVTLVTDFTTEYWAELVAWARGVLDDEYQWHHLDKIITFMIYDIHCFTQCRSQGHFSSRWLIFSSKLS